MFMKEGVLIDKMKIKFCDFDRQHENLKNDIDKAISKVISHKIFINGPELADLESKLSKRVGAKHAITVSSGTDALLVALMVKDVGPGDFIITTPFTFAATLETILFLGAKPLFTDIDSETFNIDPEKIKDLLANPIDPKTNERIDLNKIKGMIAVDLFGQSADYDKIRKAMGEDKFIIEDGAQSLGSTYKGKLCGSLGDISTTSFFPSKPLGTYGDGGMVFTDDSELAEKIKMIRNHGQEKKYEHALLGMNFRLDTLKAAVLLAKLEKFFEYEIQKRNEVAKAYIENLKSLEESDKIKLPVIKKENTSVFAQFSIVLRERDELKRFLQGKNIPAAIHYPKPLYMQKAFSELGYKEGSFPNAEKTSKQILSLPIDAYKTEHEIKFICQEIKEFFEENQAP